MQVGDVFTINDTAIAALEEAGHSVEWATGLKENKKMFRLTAGMQFKIAKNGLKLMPTELRASRLNSTTGKAIRGRPRKFPGQIVADLLGETLSDLSAAPVAATQSVPAIPATPSAVVETDTPVETVVVEVDPVKEEEDRAASEERVKALFGAMPGETGDDDW